jgi:4-amino-4-deoxy-L-arabinose transferase-like glycosyltransferase
VLRDFTRPAPAALLACGVGAILAATTLLWLALDRAPASWDDAWYLTNSLQTYDALTNGGAGAWLTKLNSVFGFKAPLIAALPTPFYLIFGRRWHAAYLVNIAAMAVLFFAVYRIARHLWTPRAAALAVAIAGTMPLLYGLARWYMVEYALAALVAFAVLVLIKSELRAYSCALLFGAACGAGLLLKVTFPVYVLPVFAYAFVRSPRRVSSLALALTACAVIAAPWYAGHLGPVYRNFIDAGYREGAAVQGTGPIFAVHTVASYLSNVAREGVSRYYIGLAAIAIVWTRGRVRPAPLLFWLLPFAVFLFGGNKDVRFIAPILPALALLLAGNLDFALPRNIAGNAILTAILAAPFVQMCSHSFGIPWRSADLPYARRFDRVVWPHDAILKAIAAASALKPGERNLILAASDRGPFNSNNLQLAAVANQLPFDVEPRPTRKTAASCCNDCARYRSLSTRRAANRNRRTSIPSSMIWCARRVRTAVIRRYHLLRGCRMAASRAC